jgi:chemotaxis protein MotA
MDRLSVIGLSTALLGIVGGQLLEGGTASFLLQSTAFMVVFGGTMGAVMLQYPFKLFVSGIKMGKWAFVTPEMNTQRLIYQFTSWSSVARKNGIVALDQLIPPIKDPFVKNGMRLLVDGHGAEKIREILEVEINAYEHYNFTAARVWESAAGYSPTIGIMGAVLGLIHVMQNLSDPTKLGDGIAVAFIATIYGVGFANMLFLPIGNKIKSLVYDQVAQREMVVEALVGIANNEHPRFIESKLRGHLVEG